GPRLGAEPGDLLFFVVVRLRDCGVRLVAASRAHALVLVVEAWGRAQRLLEPAGAVERRRPPQTIDVADLVGDRDPALLADLLLDEFHGEQRGEVLRPDRLLGPGMDDGRRRRLEVGLNVVPLRRNVLLVENVRGAVLVGRLACHAGLLRSGAGSNPPVRCGEKCANDTRARPALSTRADPIGPHGRIRSALTGGFDRPSRADSIGPHGRIRSALTGGFDPPTRPDATLAARRPGMSRTLRLPRANGTVAPYTLSGRAAVSAPAGPIRGRVAFAAVHVVADPLADVNPTLEVALDWEATLAYRRYLWSLGLAVAEAMDTSQRGMGLPWSAAKELIKRSVAEAKGVDGAVLASGAGTDHLEPGPRVTLADVEAAYEEQCGWIEGCGGRIILMASRALAACAKGPDDY